MVQITSEEYKGLIKAQSDIGKIRFLLTLRQAIGLSPSEILPEINAVVNPPEKIPFNDPNEKEELF